MSSDVNSLVKQELYHLIDSLPPKEITTAKRFLEFLLSYQDESDPLLSALMDASEDDEPLDALETASIRQSMRDIARGDAQSLELMMAERLPIGMSSVL
jgi:hypothetical protein